MNPVDFTEYHVYDVPVSPIAEKIEKFANLPIGWHYGEGIAPKIQEIELAKEIAQYATNKYLSVDSVPGISGEIQLVIYDNKTKQTNYIEIDFAPENSFNVTKYKNSQDVWRIIDDEQLSSVDDIKSKINIFWEEISPCNISEYYLSSTTYQPREGTQVRPLKSLMEGYQSFKNVASSINRLQYVPI